MSTKQMMRDALDEAERFIRGFEGDETQNGVPENILAMIAAARLPWKDRDWVPVTGDTILEIFMRHGHDHGSVRVRRWGDQYLVETFCPGREVCNEGDTPKTEPERTDWMPTQLLAAGCVDMILDGLGKQGWKRTDS